MSNLGLEADPWQIEVLDGGYQRLLLNCCRQAGKSTTVAMLAIVEAVFQPFTKVLIVSRSHRQSMEVFRIVTDFFRRLGSPFKERETQQELELSNYSRVVSLPCREETIRGYSNVSLLIIDEAARVAERRAVRVVSRGLRRSWAAPATPRTWPGRRAPTIAPRPDERENVLARHSTATPGAC